jgi:hypothetical protein
MNCFTFLSFTVKPVILIATRMNQPKLPWPQSLIFWKCSVLSLMFRLEARCYDGNPGRWEDRALMYCGWHHFNVYIFFIKANPGSPNFQHMRLGGSHVWDLVWPPSLLPSFCTGTTHSLVLMCCLSPQASVDPLDNCRTPKEGLEYCTPNPENVFCRSWSHLGSYFGLMLRMTPTPKGESKSPCVAHSHDSKWWHSLDIHGNRAEILSCQSPCLGPWMYSESDPGDCSWDSFAPFLLFKAILDAHRCQQRKGLIIDERLD